eukprot:2181527-Prymnesium_polylepis.2
MVRAQHRPVERLHKVARHGPPLDRALPRRRTDPGRHRGVARDALDEEAEGDYAGVLAHQRLIEGVGPERLREGAEVEVVAARVGPRRHGGVATRAREPQAIKVGERLERAARIVVHLEEEHGRRPALLLPVAARAVQRVAAPAFAAPALQQLGHQPPGEVAAG